jgi:hypothetical protein
VLRDPATIRRGLQALIQREVEEVRESPNLLAEKLTEKLSENARLRSAYQDQQAAGLMTLEELASRLEELDSTRKVLEAELASLERSQQKAEELERDRDAVLASLAASVPEALDNLTGEEINKVYRKLRLRLIPSEEGYDATGVICTLGPTPAERRGLGGAGGAGVTGTQLLVNTDLGSRPNSRPDKDSFNTSPFRDAQCVIAPCHLLRKGSVLRL